MFNGFVCPLDSKALVMINTLAKQVGSPTYIKTPIFSKREDKMSTSYKVPPINISGISSMGSMGMGEKKHFNKSIERDRINDDDWESLRTFQTTTFVEEKKGIDVEIDKIRMLLNKISDSSFQEPKQQIVEILNKLIVTTTTTSDDMFKVGKIIFEIASNNRFYSRLYADLFCHLINKYSVFEEIFRQNLCIFMELFDNIEYVDPEKDYNKFCIINQNNEHRKSLSLFFVNLSLCKVIQQTQIFDIITNLLNKLNVLITQENKVNEVNEISENIYLLCDKNIKITSSEEIMNTITRISSLTPSKNKDYPSLSSKAIFKFMDIVDKL
jgi:hypothetical protein